MKILVLGGTGFIGQNLIKSCPEHWEIVSFSRSKGECGPNRTYLTGEPSLGKSNYSSMKGQRFDWIIDLSSCYPDQISDLLDCADTTNYLYVSAVKVYGDLESLPVTEDNSLVEPLWDCSFDLDNESYGRYKVAFEALVGECYPGRHTIIRPQVVIGEGDRSRRLKHWLARSIAPCPRLAPGDGSDFLQVLDILDLVLFMIGVIQSEVFGIFHLGGERVTWREFLLHIGYSGLIWVPVDQLKEVGLNFQTLPLFRSAKLQDSPFGEAELMNLDCSRAKSTGFAPRTFFESLGRLASVYQYQESDLAYSLKWEHKLL